jgi:alkanesulfonate monooxygenase SsuD/methylene tetrahydromethanopterin reductase-like flavin-dependent oxidoreductase (luciferase family)
VAALGHNTVPYQLIARAADIGFITPRDRANAAEILGEIRGFQEEAGRGGEPLHVFGDLVVFLDDSAAAARDRWQRLDEAAGAPYTSDALIFAGTAAELADLLLDWREAGLTGFRLRPAVLPHDLTQVTEALVPELRRRGAFRGGYPDGGWAATLRGLLGLARPASRYSASRPEAPVA